MLKESGVSYTLREYTTDPLSKEEIRSVLQKLNMTPRDLLRMREAKKQDLNGDEPDSILIEHMAANPRLVNRPIALDGDRALIARPADLLHDWLR